MNGSDLAQGLAQDAWGRARLRTLLVVAESRSFCDAARRLDLRQCQVSTQVASLEEWVGGTVVTRASDAKPLALTPLGARLVRETRATGLVPASLPRVPEPMRSAMLVFRAEQRLARLVVVVHSASLAEAAVQLHTDAGTLRQSLVALEHALGYELLVTKGRHVPVKLTPRGRRLVSQYADALPK